MDQIGDAIQGLINLLDMLGALVRKAWRRKRLPLNKEIRSRDNTWLGAATLLILGLLVIFLFGCGQEPGRNSPYNASGFDTGKDEAAAGDTVQHAQAGGVPVTANDLAKLIVDGTVPEHLDEASVQGMVDGLSDMDPATRRLQARAVTKLWPKADGAIAESMGLAALEYVSAHPAEFIALFDQDLGEKDLQVWADMLAQEILIDSEEGPLEAWAERIPDLERGCSTCTQAQRERTGIFVKLVSERIHALNTTS